jgi:hypothetical protein
MSLGADAFLGKPIDAEELFGKVGAVLSLSWTYGPVEPARVAEAEGNEPEHAPPAYELKVLHRLAREGDMQQIIRWAERMAAQDEHCGAFAGRVRGLAKQYQSRAVLYLVEEYLARAGIADNGRGDARGPGDDDFIEGVRRL